MKVEVLAEVLIRLVGTDASVFIWDDLENPTADVYIGSREFAEILLKECSRIEAKAAA